MQKSTYAEFDISEYDIDNTVVRCSTQEEADEFLEYLYRKGVWRKEDAISVGRNWNYYGDTTCYHISKKEWCYDSWFVEEYGYTVIDFFDLRNKPNPKEITFSFEEMMGLSTQEDTILCS